MTDRLGSLEVQGRAGDLLLVRDDTLGRVVAARVLSEGAGPAEAGAFLDRARLAARLDHPGIVPVHELLRTEDGRPFVTLKRVTGETLPELARREGSLARRLEAFLKLCDAVAFAHDRGVVHHALSPASVVVGRFGEVLLGDWDRAGPGDPRQDVLGLGQVLAALIAGRDAPWELQAVVRKATAAAPEARYPGAQALREDVAGFLQGRLVAAARYGPLDRAARWARRNRATLAASLGGLLPLLLLAGQALGAAREARAFADDAAAARAAVEDGRHGDALLACARALARREDPALRALAAGSAAALEREGRARAAAREAAERAARLQEALRPVARKIDETRPFFHVAHVDIRRKLDEVEALLEPLEALAREPGVEGAAEPWVLLGVGWTLVGRPARARAALERAHALAPDDARARYHLARLELEAGFGLLFFPGQRADASRHAAAALRLLDPPSLAAGGGLEQTVVAVMRAMARSDLEGAAALVREGIERHRGELGVSELWFLRACCDAGQQQRCVERALELQPHHPWAYFVRAALRAADGDLARARADLDAALAIHPRFVPALVNRSGVRERQRDLQGALEDIDRALAEEPDLAPAHRNRGNHLMRLGRLEEALAAHERSVALDPGSPMSWLGLGGLLGRLRRLEQADAAYVRAAELDPASGEAWEGRAYLALQRGDRDAAIALLREAQRRDPGPHYGSVLARLLEERGDAAGARAALEEAATLGAPESGPEWLARAGALERLGRLEAAADAYDRAVAVDPANGNAFERRAGLRQRRGDLRAALEDLDRAVELLAPRARLHLQRGEARRKAGDAPGALEDFARAEALGDPMGAERAGRVHLERGAREEARAAWERAAARGGPDAWRAWSSLGLLREEDGDVAGARAAYQQARGGAPRDERIRIEARLADLPP